jgi:hypothetical protein
VGLTRGSPPFYITNARGEPRVKPGVLRPEIWALVYFEILMMCVEAATYMMEVKGREADTWQCLLCGKVPFSFSKSAWEKLRRHL